MYIVNKSAVGARHTIQAYTCLQFLYVHNVLQSVIQIFVTTTQRAKKEISIILIIIIHIKLATKLSYFRETLTILLYSQIAKEMDVDPIS